MREIKFRGRRILRGRRIHSDSWAYGDLITVVGGCDIRVRSKKSDLDAYHIPVDPDTVGQFTGLRDSDGREIYEGDIVRFKEAYKGALGDERVHDVVGVVSYVYCEFKIVSDGTSELWAPCLMDGVTVIGNVHDDPKLLEVTHD